MVKRQRGTSFNLFLTATLKTRPPNSLKQRSKKSRNRLLVISNKKVSNQILLLLLYLTPLVTLLPLCLVLVFQINLFLASSLLKANSLHRVNTLPNSLLLDNFPVNSKANSLLDNTHNKVNSLLGNILLSSCLLDNTIINFLVKANSLLDNTHNKANSLHRANILLNSSLLVNLNSLKANFHQDNILSKAKASSHQGNILHKWQ